MVLSSSSFGDVSKSTPKKSQSAACVEAWSQKYRISSLAMPTGYSEMEQTSFLLCALYLFNWPHQFVLDCSVFVKRFAGGTH